MKIEQNPKFQPITITIESKEEAEAIWQAIRNMSSGDSDRDAILRKVSDWFINMSQLGGN